jgi:hypothetical protein
MHGRALSIALRGLLDYLSDVYAPELQKVPLPSIYLARPRYQPEPRVLTGEGPEEWAAPWTSFERMWVDCDDAVLWRLAELKLQGIPAHAQIVRQTVPDSGKFHARIRLPSGLEEDPSLLLLRKGRNGKR